MHKLDPMTARASDSAAMLPYWKMTDTIVAGVDAMRAAGQVYMPKFPDEDDTSYKFRVSLSKLTNIYRDTVEALSSKPFEYPITFADGNKPSAEIEEFTKNVDGGGADITSFGAATFFNGINSAIDWIFVDYPNVADNIVTLADSKRVGLRPFWSRVLARNVLEASAQVIAGNEQLIYIRICEPGSVDHVRIFRRNGEIVTWALFKKTDKTRKVDGSIIGWLNGASPNDETWYELIEEGTLSIPVIPLVPFSTGRRHGRTFCFSPAMQDAAELQIELYNAESDLKYAKKMTAFPMLAGNGVKPQLNPDNTPKKLATGPNVVLYGTPDGNGNIPSWEYVEPSSQSLTFLAADIDTTKKDLRELGRQPLTAQSGNLTVITTAVAAGKAKSAVSAWAGALALALDSALKITMMFLGTTDEKVQTQVYDDFDEFDASGNDLTALSTMRKNRDLSQVTYWAEMQRRRVLSDKFDAEAEQTELLKEAPADELADDEVAAA